jgi:hypothetical protein
MRKIFAILMVALSATAYAQNGGIGKTNLSRDLYRQVMDGLLVRNETSSTITAAQLVYICGWSENETSTVASSPYTRTPKVCLADADVAGARAQFIATNAIVNNAPGQVWKATRLTSVATSTGAIGDPVYLSSTAGGWTLTKPTPPAAAQIIGRVAVVSASVGVVEVNLPIENVSVGSVDMDAGQIQPDDQGLAIRNETGSPFAAGDLVYVSSWNAAQSRFLVTKADADASGAKAQYIMRGTLATATNGYAYRTFAATAVNTDGSTVGDPVYLDTTAGGWVLAAPVAANAINQIVGRVKVVNVSAGTIEFDLLSLNSPISVGSNEIAADAITSAKIVNGAIVDADVNANAAIARSKLAEDALQMYGIPISRLRQVTGIQLAATETAGNFYEVVSANVFLAKGEVTDNETETSVTQFQFILPPDYVAAGDVTIRIPCAIVKTGSPTDNGSTIDVAVFEQSNGTVGADLSTTTAAATFAALDTWYNKDFVITAAGLVAGDIINVVITAAIIDSEAGAGSMLLNMSPPRVMLDIKG